MTLQMKTKCEKCGAELASDGDAFICSYECTFCSECVKNMKSVCPNCSGDLVPRPRRNTD